MSRNTKILIAYDGSRYADSALADLRRAGLGPKVEAKVITVADLWFPPAAAISGPAEGWFGAAFETARLQAGDAQKEAETLAEKAVSRLRKDFPSWKVGSTTLMDSPAHGILTVAEKWKPGLIVMGSHGRTALGRVLLGSVSHKVLAHAECNVRIAKPVSGRGSPAPRVLVAVDGSKDAAAALRTLTQRVWSQDAEFKVVLVVDFRLSLAQAFENDTGSNRPIRGWPFRGTLAEKLVEQAVCTLADRGLKVTSVLREGEPRRELILEAKRFKANNLFLGSRGLGAVKRFFLGSVSLSVAGQSPCTVEVVRR